MNEGHDANKAWRRLESMICAWGQRIEDRFSDRVFALYTLPDHRFGYCLHSDGHGYDDAVAHYYLLAVQNHAVCPSRRLGHGYGFGRVQL